MSGAPRTRSWLQQIIHTPGATSPGTIIIYRSTGTGSRSPFLAVLGPASFLPSLFTNEPFCIFAVLVLIQPSSALQKHKSTRSTSSNLWGKQEFISSASPACNFLSSDVGAQFAFPPQWLSCSGSQRPVSQITFA